MEATSAVHAPPESGPLSLLHEEREVQAFPAKMSYLFAPFLQDLYERRLWQEIERFESFSTGARLVSSLDLATAHTGEMVSTTEAAQLDQFHAERRKWLVSYLMGGACQADCRGKLVDVMLSSYGQAQGDYDEPFRKLLLESRTEAAAAFAHLHARLLWCQVADDSLALFRDRVLVPALTEALANPKTDATLVEDLVGLVALVPEPAATDAAATAAWKKVLGMLPHTSEHLQRTFNSRRAASVHERANPPPMIRKVNFCGAAAMADAPAGAKP